MERLTSLSDWDSVWTGFPRAPANPVSQAAPQTAPRTTPRTHGVGLRDRFRELRRDYADYLEWDVLFAEHLARGTGRKAIEIGSAPGTTTIRLHRTFGYDPYGVEYSAPGAALNRANFIAAGIDPAHVFHADALSEEFLAAHEGAYDLVVSRGFIEHFTDMHRVIDAHVRLVKPGGRLVVSIPKLVGLPGALFRVFNPGVIPLHNLAIMERRAFASLFDRDGLRELHCGNIGTFRVHVCGSDRTSGPRAALMGALMNAQLGLNAAFRLCLGSRGAESALCSPYLIYIGSRVR
ncbi:MAG: class I SAM-dependent methyltransferase [Planctomycetes bacterium]|nr:class I SAM-dependent methyltransferase [Planctomycetota bacterium]